MFLNHFCLLLTGWFSQVSRGKVCPLILACQENTTSTIGAQHRPKLAGANDRLHQGHIYRERGLAVSEICYHMQKLNCGNGCSDENGWQSWNRAKASNKPVRGTSGWPEAPAVAGSVAYDGTLFISGSSKTSKMCTSESSFSAVSKYSNA